MFIIFLIVTIVATWFSFLTGGTVDQYFAMCLITKNENENLAEWIEYHKRMGSSKFYIFDHNSTVPLLNGIQQYVTSGLVEYFYFTDFGNVNSAPQIIVYDRCLRLFGNRHKFIGFLDIDEFIVVKNNSLKIPDILSEYEEYSSVALDWMMFGSSGHVVQPPGGVLGNYEKCFKTGHVKNIVNPSLGARVSGNPHYFTHAPGKFAVSMHNTTVPEHIDESFHDGYDKMYINHYNTKSLSEFIAKMTRGRGAMKNPHKYSLDYITRLDEKCVDDCPILTMPPL